MRKILFWLSLLGSLAFLGCSPVGGSSSSSTTGASGSNGTTAAPTSVTYSVGSGAASAAAAQISGSSSISLALGTTSTVLNLGVKDQNGNYLAGVTLAVTSDTAASLQVGAPGSQVTDETGFVNGYTLTTTQVSATAHLQIVATLGSTSITKSLTVIVGSPSSTGGGITLAVLDASNTALFPTTLTSGSPYTAQVTVLDTTSGKPLPNALVAFSTGSSTTIPVVPFATFAPAEGTALTDKTGKAAVVMTAGTINGAFTLTAAVTYNGTTQTVSTNYSVSGASSSTPNATLSLNVALGQPSISAYGSTNVQVSVMQTVGTGIPTPYTTPLVVSFASNCASSTPTYATITPTATTVNGVANASYKDNGCASTDVINVSIAGTNLNGTASLVVKTPSLGSIQFYGVTPPSGVIALKGTGGTGRSESAVVSFKVVDQEGKPIAAPVTFSLNTSIGGVNLPVTTANSDRTTGVVSAIVQSGNVSTPVIVTASATLSGVTLSTQSDFLSVSTGIADQWHFTAAPQYHNFEGGDYVGTTVQISALAADHFGNQVPDGTVVQFTTNGGSIQAQCHTGSAAQSSTANALPAGECAVTYTSQTPRPNFDYPNFNNTTPIINPNAAVAWDQHLIINRTSILVTAIGEESFQDLTGSGLAVGPYGTVANGGSGDLTDPGGFSTDIGEAYLDAAWNLSDAQTHSDGYEVAGAYDPAYDYYIDFNGNGKRDAPDGVYEGVLCNASYAKSPCPTGTATSLNVFRNVHMVMSGSTALITFFDYDQYAQGASAQANTKAAMITHAFPLSSTGCYDPKQQNPGFHHIGVLVSDEYYNVMPAGTTINILPTGLNVSGIPAGGQTFIVPDSTGFYSLYDVYVQPGGTLTGGLCTNVPASSYLAVTVTTPTNSNSNIHQTITTAYQNFVEGSYP